MEPSLPVDTDMIVHCFFKKGISSYQLGLGMLLNCRPAIGGLFTLVIALMNLVTGLALVNHFIISYWGILGI